MSELNWRRPLVLAVFLCALGGFAFWLEYKHKPEQEEQQEQTKKVFQLDKSQIHSIRVANGTHEFLIQCADASYKTCKPGDNAKWELLEPIKVKADDGNSNSLVSTVNSLAASDTINLKDETPEKRAALLKDYGLDIESLAKDRQIQINSNDATTVLYLGQTHPIGEGIFAAVERLPVDQKPTGKVDGTQIYVLPTYFKGSFDHDLTYWRDKKILPVSAHEIDAFTLKNSKGEFHAERKNGEWTINQDYPGDIESIDSLLTGATYLTAKDFVSDNKKDAKARAILSGAKPVITFTLKQDKVDQPTILTLFTKANGKPPAKGVVQNRVFATVSTLDPVFELEGYAKERFEKDLKDLRLSKLINSMDRFQAKRLQFEGANFGPHPWSLVNKDSKWSVEGETPGKNGAEKIDSEKVQNFLDRLSSSKIQQFVSEKLPPESDMKTGSALQFTLGDETRPVIRKILFWRVVEKSGQKLYARDLLSTRKEVFLLDPSLVDGIPWEKAKFK